MLDNHDFNKISMENTNKKDCRHYTIILRICHNFIKYSISGSNSDNQHYQWWLRFVPWDTKAHLVNPSQCFTFCKAIFFRESALWELRPGGLIPSNFFTGCKAIIARESSQWKLSPIGIISRNFLLFAKKCYQDIWPKEH